MATTGWFVLAADSTGRSSQSFWSPDGTRLFVVTGGGSGGSGGLATLITAAGETLATYEGVDSVAWVDLERFLLLRRKPGEGERPWVARSGAVGTDVLSEVDVPLGHPLTNGHGTLAFDAVGFDYAEECGFGCPLHEFNLWNDGRYGEPREGLPIAWGPDGDRLYVLHDVRQLEPGTGAPAGADFIGWLEILELPNLESVRRLPETRITDRFVALDASGEFLMFEESSDSAQQRLTVLNVASGATETYRINRQGFAWDGNNVVIGPPMKGSRQIYDNFGFLDSITPGRGSATVRSVDGSVVDEWNDVGQSVAGAPDGSAVALSDEEFTDARAFISVFSEGQRTDVEPLPIDGYIAVFCGWPSIAPGGEALVVGCSLSQRGTESGLAALFLHDL